MLYILQYSEIAMGSNPRLNMRIESGHLHM